MLALTVDVEEGFHGLWPSAHSTMEHHESPEGAFIKPLRSLLNLFEEYHVSSTFFVLGEIAEIFPEVVEESYDRGHEIGSHGYSHVDFTRFSLSRLEEMERKSRGILAKTTGEEPIGFRAPFARINPAIVSLLSRMGYVYDSSVVPSLGVPGWWSNYGASLSPYRIDIEDKEFFEVPIAVFPFLRLPIGGWFLRNFGVAYVEAAIRWFLRRGIPVVVYVHPFDVDSEVERLGGFRFHITRHCGEYTLKAIRNLLETFDCPKVPIRDTLREIMVHKA
ncbi:MAG: polysaccharide deacetylase family protein [Candidatus Bathyarchaeia archaeon]